MNTRVLISRKLLLAAVALAVINFSSCTKYEEGNSVLSFQTATGRLTKKWQVTKYESTNPYDGTTEDMLSMDLGDQVVDVDMTVEFDKEGDFVMEASMEFTYYGINIPYTYTISGDWEFIGDDKKKLEMTFVYPDKKKSFEASSLPRIFRNGNNKDLTESVVQVMDIMLLKTKELALEYSYYGYNYRIEAEKFKD